MSEENEKTMDAKGMIATAVKEKKTISYGERKKIEIIADTKYYKKGQVIEPHSLMADQLIKDKIAKELK